MPRKKGSKNKKKFTTKKEDPLKDYKEEDKEKGDSIFDEGETVKATTSEELKDKKEVEEIEPIEEVKEIKFDENALIRNSRRIVNYTEGIKNMVDRSKGAGRSHDIPKMLHHLRRLADLSAGHSTINGYIKTMEEKVNVCKAIHVKKERIPVILEIGKIADDLLDEIKPYARRR